MIHTIEIFNSQHPTSNIDFRKKTYARQQLIDKVAQCIYLYWSLDFRFINFLSGINQRFGRSICLRHVDLSLICWDGTMSMKSKVLLSRVGRSASNIVGMTLPTMNELYESYKKKTYITKHISSPARVLFCC